MPILSRYPTLSLNRTETELLRLICEGFSDADIGECLAQTERCVREARNGLIEKFGLKNTTQLMLRALTGGYTRVSWW
ncbi:MAG TPA: hypothetical protein DCE41_16170 [Cytophagales bacterium]|nr:hypothetical protein [Cytophagales bacterium]HAA22492.1 hypothetical protein [Cytophagales bacterium]HAP62165.1 hypothetical protein [Cytophagales bacterium]